jgi:hypothetical protein
LSIKKPMVSCANKMHLINVHWWLINETNLQCVEIKGLVLFLFYSA